MKRILLFLLMLNFVSLAGVAVATGSEEILARAVVPSTDKPQGEVQLVRRGEELVVRTVLASPILKRVVAAIDKKEQRRWPEGQAGHVDSRRYREEVFTATSAIWERFKERSDKSDKRQYLAIEFILGPRQNDIALSEPQLTGDYGQLRVENKSSLAEWRASRDYVAENMKEIIRDSFGKDADAVEKLLNANWPVRP